MAAKGFGLLSRALAALRVVFALSASYLHPDEYFQSFEPAAASIGLRASLPWEFGGPLPFRSRLPPLLTCALPLLPLDGLGVAARVAAVRLFLCAASFAADAGIARLCRAHGVPPRRIELVLLVHASAWPTLVFSSRPFSNSLEALLLVAALLSTPAVVRRAAAAAAPPAAAACARLGALLPLGLWCRFTFGLLWAPLGLSCAVAAGARGRGAMLASALVVGAALLAADCAIHGGACVHAPWRCIAPFNSLAYNLSPSNLAAHGVHPRLTHVLLNLPMLAGPLAIAAYLDAASRARAALPFGLGGARGSGRQARRVVSYSRPRSSASASAVAEGENASAPAGAIGAATRVAGGATEEHVEALLPASCPILPSRVRALLRSCVLLYLLFLSLAPHQEARFLLPLMAPLALLYGHSLLGSRRRLWAWVAFNGSLALFFAGCHQAGLLRAMHHLHAAHPHASAQPATAVFFHTYPPPPSLLGQPASAPPSLSLVALSSEVGTQELASTLSQLRAERRRPPWRGQRKAAGGPPLYVVLPATQAPALRRELACASRNGWASLRPPLLGPSSCRAASRVRLELERAFWPHWSAEEEVRAAGDATLEVYRVM